MKFQKEYHGVDISVRTLRRRLIEYGLRRRQQPSAFIDVWNAIHDELRGPGIVPRYSIAVLYCCHAVSLLMQWCHYVLLTKAC